MKVIVAGGGKVGFYLTQTLIAHGHDPHLIEEDKKQCALLADSLDVPITHGDASLISVLESADTQDADAIVCVTGLDETNLVICELAKKRFNVKRTVARVNNPKNAEVMRRLGVDIPISSTDNIVHLLEREIDSSAMRLLTSINQGEASLSELEVPQQYKLHGVRLSELRMPQESIIVSITRNGQLVIPRGNTQIFSGDKILVICKNRVVHDIPTALQIPV